MQTLNQRSRSGKTKDFLRAILILSCAIPFFLASKISLAQSIVLKNAKEAPTPIAIQAFVKALGKAGDLPKVASDLEAMLTADLIFSRIFKVIPAEAFLQPDVKGAIDIIQVESWRQVGAQYVVRGKVSRGDGQVSLDGYVFDILTGKLVLQKNYRTRRSDYSILSHEFGDDIVEVVTGKKGLFSTKIVFSYVPPGKKNKELWLMDFNGRNGVPLVQNGRYNIGAEWTRDGHYIYYSASSLVDWNLWKTDLHKHQTQITHYKGSALGASMMPNGREMVVSLSKDGNPDIYLAALDGTIKKRLTAARGINVSPHSSPDGKRICYSSDRLGNLHVFSLDMQTLATERLTRVGTKNDSCAWNPMDNLILFSGLDDTPEHRRDFDVFMMDDRGNNMERLTYDASWNQDPSWSPDGKLIAFSSRRTGRNEIWVMKADGTQPAMIVELPGAATQPSWSPRLGY